MMVPLTCPACSKTIAQDDAVVFTDGRISHLDCGRPSRLSVVEQAILFSYCRDHAVVECPACSASYRMEELAGDVFKGSSNLCPACRRDLTTKARAHIYSCAAVPQTVRDRARIARKTTLRVLKHGQELVDQADVLLREAEAALRQLRETLHARRHRPE